MKMVLRYERKSQPQCLLWALILLLFVFGTLTDWLHLPGAVRYILDPVWIWLLILLVRFREKLCWKDLRGLVLWVLVSFLLPLAGALVLGTKPHYFLWGMRNHFRGYVNFFAVAVFWTHRDVQQFWTVMERLFWLNAGVSLVQFGMGYRQDFLGGLFGVYSGVNTYTNLFFAVVLSHSLVSCLAEREGLLGCGLKCAAALFVAAMAELKFFFGEFLVILVLAVVLSERSTRKFWVILGGTGVVLAGAALLAYLFPGWENWFSLEKFWQIASDQRGYTSSGDLNRLTAVSEINRRFFHGFWEKIFGLGLGNCELSGFSFLTTPFAREYQHLHYHWMSIAFVYLEMGWLGLVFFFWFFLLVFFRGKRCADPVAGRVSQIMAVICLLTGIYNASLRSEAGYLAYVSLALAFVPEGENHGK